MPNADIREFLYLYIYCGSWKALQRPCQDKTTLKPVWCAKTNCFARLSMQTELSWKQTNLVKPPTKKKWKKRNSDMGQPVLAPTSLWDFQWNLSKWVQPLNLPTTWLKKVVGILSWIFYEIFEAKTKWKSWDMGHLAWSLWSFSTSEEKFRFGPNFNAMHWGSEEKVNLDIWAIWLWRFSTSDMGHLGEDFPPA